MLLKNQQKETSTQQSSHLEALDTLKQTISSLEKWDGNFGDWMKSILWHLQASHTEIEALTIAADVGGWLTYKEAAELYKLASWVPEENAVCCELGSWLGKSSVILAKALEHKKNAKLYCIDPFDLLKDEPWHKSEFQKQAGPTNLTRKQVVANTMKDNDLDSVVELVEDFSENYINQFDRPIDLLFIDADHAYESVVRDYKNWSPLVKSGGFIAFHDYYAPGSDHEGPRLAINECVVNNPEWSTQWLADSLYVAQKA